MRFRILGPLEVLSPNGWTAIGAPKWRSLLACLLVRPGQLVPTESLIYELWGDNPPSTANNLVSIYVHRLKKVIGDTEGELLLYRAPGYMLRVAPGDLDLQVFESLAAEGRAALASADPQRAAGLLGEALGLWRGALLADVLPSPLLANRADRAAELRLTTTELRVEADLECGSAVQVIPELRGLVAEHPLRERLWALLMRALEEAGRRSEALEAYARAREAIADELGTDPGSELQRLYAELLAADASTASLQSRPRRARAVPGTPGWPRVGRGGCDSRCSDGGDARGPLGSRPRTPTTARARSVQALTRREPSRSAQSPSRPWRGQPRQRPRCQPRRSPGSRHPSRAPRSFPPTSGTSPAVRRMSRTCAPCCSRANPASTPGAVPIAVVSGAGGLGKTTLAVHAAHQVRAKFPDGQLYVDLLGASAQPAEPGEVLARFLRDLGIEGEKVPAREDERAALYRTTLVGRRVLILLDNARDAAQVRPLLPGSSSCAVLVTARNRTSDLASTRFVDLNVLEDTEALVLFSRVVGDDRAAAEPDATAEVLVACAGLPLAIRICAARLAARRQWRIATLAGRLRSEHRRLDELSIGDLAVRASFQVSYDSLRSVAHGLDPGRVFRLLGLWQGSQIRLAAAAALVGAPEDDAADALETLVDANLLESPAPDWYRLHDLLRVYATERAEAEEPEAERAEAVHRLLWWYLDTTEAAANAVSPQRYQVSREAMAPGYPPLTFTGLEEALAWYDDERANIVSATRLAVAAGLHDAAWRLPPTLFPVFSRRSNWVDCVTISRIGLESAQRAGNRAGEAWVLNQMGFALARLRDREAFDRLEQALAIRRELGDTGGRRRPPSRSARDTSRCTGQVRKRCSTCVTPWTCLSPWA